MKIKRTSLSIMESYIFRCPGCNGDHVIPVAYTPEYERARKEFGASVEVWHWNGLLDRPTFNPSLLVKWGRDNKYVCHSFITKGKIHFLGDSTHPLKGQTIEMADVEE